jgi:hypothetical protein
MVAQQGRPWFSFISGFVMEAFCVDIAIHFAHSMLERLRHDFRFGTLGAQDYSPDRLRLCPFSQAAPTGASYVIS